MAQARSSDEEGSGTFVTTNEVLNVLDVSSGGATCTEDIMR
jgi:hypothetical protein